MLVNGYEDIVARVNFFNPFEHSLISLGQYKQHSPYAGRISNMILILAAFKDDEILRMAENYDVSQVLKDLHYTESLGTFVSGTIVPQDKFLEIGVAD